jgi:endonuclease YncB( thermonuclease family)
MNRSTLQRLRCAAAAGSLFAALAQAAPPPAAPRTLQGVVTHVTDGDSLWFTPTAQAAVEVRLRDIDAPEICQPWGEEARRALAELALGKPATLRILGRDVYGRALGVLLVDEIDVGKHQVEEGHAWSIRTHWDQGPLVKQERMARALARGLHAAGGAVMPREFRQTHGPCSGAAPAGTSARREPVPATPVPAMPAPALPVRATPAPATPAPPGASFRCDGRVYCSQMTSCQEAEYFLAHCPGVKMDGNRDGVPCEQQWCRR